MSGEVMDSESNDDVERIDLVDDFRPHHYGTFLPKQKSVVFWGKTCWRENDNELRRLLASPNVFVPRKADVTKSDKAYRAMKLQEKGSVSRRIRVMQSIEFQIVDGVPRESYYASYFSANTGSNGKTIPKKRSSPRRIRDESYQQNPM